MTTRSKRTTVYLDPYLYKALRMKAIVSETSVSEIINEAIRLELAEDAEDIAAFEERKDEPVISYEEMMKRLKKDGLI
ncbi:MAG: CopG family transcriptional regulator [Chloroflexi bacterium RBG_16_50_11]|nr:MAG: CopG family transcriptional regulator [Chloroflexi bacterium RBG_16_50_11]